ncbi:lipoprotein [Aeromonas simiae]|uniref:LPS translocon maturation chaperone LptM n=1 Tax=Aeromonas simiae TaxID=218936 RepID=UPI0038D11494
MAALLCLGLTACGLKGPLYMPPVEQPKAEQPSAPQELPATTEQTAPGTEQH